MREIVPLGQDEPSQALIESISNSIYPFVVGIIHKGDLVGSGTFVRAGKRRGILTAYHVIHSVTPAFDFRAGSADTLGLIVVKERSHRFEIPLGLGLISVVDIAKPTNEEYGPDLAFIEIAPSSFLDDLEARRDFFNLDSHEQLGLRLNLSQTDPVVISGFQHEGHFSETDRDGFSQVEVFKGFAGFTGIERRLEHDNYDLCELTVDYSLGGGAPKSFGGYSGGGLWNVVLTKDGATGKIDHQPPILAGVLFYQQQISEDRKILRSHLTQSIYRRALQTLRS